MYLPTNDSKSSAEGAGWGVRIFFLLVFVGLGLIACFSDGQFAIPLGIALIVLGLVLGYFGYGWGYSWATNNSRCPNCKKPFCIEYTQEKTVSESIISEAKEGKSIKIVRYRVGVKGINWRCTSCGYEGYGEKNYKEQI